MGKRLICKEIYKMSQLIKQYANPIQFIFSDSAIVTEEIFTAVKSITERKPSLKSPLRYPGGKTRGVKEIIKFFPSDLKRVCSPFLGGGSIEIDLANNGVQVFGYDIFEPVTDFWQVLLEDSKLLGELVRKYYPLTSSKFYSLQLDYGKIQSKKERAAVFFALNRSSFSGATLSGGMSLGHPRFNESAIERLENFTLDNLYVERADFKVSLKKHKDDFLYLDPPYANGEKLYGKNGDAHEHFDHEGLAEIITKRDGWILSYNDHPKVRKLYHGFKAIPLKWAYGMNNSKKSNELLILSKN